MKSTRTYTQTARAAATEATRARILESVVALARERRLATISLDEVAAAAGVSVQTVLRQFGSRAGLTEAAAARARAQITAQREAPAGEVETAVRVIVEHYEQQGRPALLLLAQEDEDPLVREITEAGRALHRAWVSEVFAPFDPQPADIDLLVVATDVYAWKLLRLDRGLSRSETCERLTVLVRALLHPLPTTQEEAHR